jgi:hypothetical protein
MQKYLLVAYTEAAEHGDLQEAISILKDDENLPNCKKLWVLLSTIQHNLADADRMFRKELISFKELREARSSCAEEFFKTIERLDKMKS